MFYYTVRAVTLGTFRYAPIVAEAMYDGNYYSASGQAIVRSPAKSFQMPLSGSVKGKIGRDKYSVGVAGGEGRGSRDENKAPGNHEV